MAQVRLEHPEGGELILEGSFEELSQEDREFWQGEIRRRRELECFPLVNRGKPWYDQLTETQRAELSAWYQAWLGAPRTGTVPAKPIWIDRENHFDQ